MHYLNWICELGILPCLSVLDAKVFGGGFGDSFSQRVQCTTCILCLQNTSGIPVVVSSLPVLCAEK